MARLVLPVIGTLATLTACHDATDHDKQTVIGRIDPLHTGVPVILAPEEVRVNQAFEVVVQTIGSSDCTTTMRSTSIGSGSRGRAPARRGSGWWA